ncbi:MAG: elongation factor G [Dichotomicrobium sp.]
MADTGAHDTHGPRCIALVGPFSSGKTTLLEALMARTGAINRQGTIGDANTLGDNDPAARAHRMSVELNVGQTEFLGDSYTFVDCPGSIEFHRESVAATAACDAAVVVCEADPRKVPALQVVLKNLEDRGIPHLLFLNKVDKTDMRLRDILPMLQPASARPLVLRHIPIWENGIATGFIDLALERAFVYREHAPSEVIERPAEAVDRHAEARFSMLEQLADYDDELMEQLLEDIEPPRDKVFDDLARELREGVICPVLIGSAERGNGILRLLKALRHEAPPVDQAAQRLGVADWSSALAVFKTLHTAHGGKLSLTRVLRGSVSEGAIVYSPNGEDRAAGVFAIKGQEFTKRGGAEAGETVALARLDHTATGDMATTLKDGPHKHFLEAGPAPVYGVAINAAERKDEVRLTTALGKVCDEDPSLVFINNTETGGMELWGFGEMHLRLALERLESKYGIKAETRPRKIPYKETIRKSTEVRGRHKKQSGGHGQFGDVVLEIKPLPRGGGFEFSETITGGAVPKQYIPAVEAGVKDFLTEGPLGFPVVDLAVCLKDGSYHSVDSSEQAFRAAGRLAMSEGIPKCESVLLEPFSAVEIIAPSEATPKINQIISARRGHIHGFDAREGWTGWDIVWGELPESETRDLILELRSATAGVGSFTAKFDHMAELNGKLAEKVVAGETAAA